MWESCLAPHSRPAAQSHANSHLGCNGVTSVVLLLFLRHRTQARNHDRAVCLNVLDKRQQVLSPQLHLTIPHAPSSTSFRISQLRQPLRLSVRRSSRLNKTHGNQTDLSLTAQAQLCRMSGKHASRDAGLIRIRSTLRFPSGRSVRNGANGTMSSTRRRVILNPLDKRSIPLFFCFKIVAPSILRMKKLLTTPQAFPRYHVLGLLLWFL